MARIVLILAVGDVSSSTTAAQPQLCTLDFDSLCEQFATKLPHISGMLGKSLVSPISTVDSVTRLCFSTPCIGTAKSGAVCSNVSFSYQPAKYMIMDVRRQSPYPRKWEIHSTAQVESLVLSDEDKKTWEACRQALSMFSFSDEEQDKMLGKAFGHIHSPYWGEDRKKEVPNIDTVNEILEYLRTLGLSNDDLSKLLKKFPEVLGCNLEQELKTNVQLLEKEWGIQGKSLRSLLLRNPKVLGYNVDCKGDCIAKCTRCWVRF